MEIATKLKCKVCGDVIEFTGTCRCQKVVLNENVILVGVVGTDYEDITPKLLNG